MLVFLKREFPEISKMVTGYFLIFLISSLSMLFDGKLWINETSRNS